ncbi:hypothetical protein ABZ153_10175 [Streptomyces sp. NPDC006290]|uniref:hypothetical protein n=1 Tax=Streptomyces sp. NPDC006290 TaxID=3156745 RepID=UPI0033A41584
MVEDLVRLAGLKAAGERIESVLEHLLCGNCPGRIGVSGRQRRGDQGQHLADSLVLVLRRVQLLVVGIRKSERGMAFDGGVRPLDCL